MSPPHQPPTHPHRWWLWLWASQLGVAWLWWRHGWQVGPADVLLIVGCGSSSRALAQFVDVSVWIEAPEAVRRARVTLREGDPSAWWGLWAAQEERLLEQRDSRVLATYVVDESAESS